MPETIEKVKSEPLKQRNKQASHIHFTKPFPSSRVDSKPTSEVQPYTRHLKKQNPQYHLHQQKWLQLPILSRNSGP